MPASFLPDGKRLAIVFNVAYETWAEGKSPAIGPMGNPLPQGFADSQAQSWGKYGARRGIWNLLDLFDRHRVAATVFASARLAETHADTLKALAGSGHEVCGHGYTQDVLQISLDTDEERKLIDRCSTLLAQTTGERPTGWVSVRGTPSPATSPLLAAAGYTWHGDFFDDECPSVEQFDGRPLVSLPLKMEINDLPMCVRHGNPPKAMLETFTDLVTWGLKHPESTCYLDVTVHTHVFGRAYGCSILDRIITEAREVEGVWITTRASLAERVLEAEVSKG